MDEMETVSKWER